MNITEAIAVHRALRFVTGLVLWEHEDGQLDLEEMKEAMAWLGGRAQHALKAGPSEDEVRAAVARAFGE